jgi:hypothetical protein
VPKLGLSSVGDKDERKTLSFTVCPLDTGFFFKVNARPVDNSSSEAEETLILENIFKGPRLGVSFKNSPDC